MLLANHESQSLYTFKNSLSCSYTHHPVLGNTFRFRFSVYLKSSMLLTTLLVINNTIEKRMKLLFSFPLSTHLFVCMLDDSIFFLSHPPSTFLVSTTYLLPITSNTLLYDVTVKLILEKCLNPLFEIFHISAMLYICKECFNKQSPAFKLSVLYSHMPSEIEFTYHKALFSEFKCLMYLCIIRPSAFCSLLPPLISIIIITNI